MPRKKKVVVEDEIIDNPEEVTIEEVTPPEDNIVVKTLNGEYVTGRSNIPTIIETGVIVNGKREFKNTLAGTTFIED